MSELGKPVTWASFGGISFSVAGLLVAAFWQMDSRVRETRAKAAAEYEKLRDDMIERDTVLQSQYTRRINGIMDHFGAEDRAMNRRLDAVAASVNTPRAQAVYPKRP